jgi:type II secretory pathway component GspD/PulD (secretin)
MTNEITAFFTDMAVDKGLRVLFETNGLALSEKDGLNYLIPSGGGFDDASKEKSSRVKYFVTEKNKKISFNVNNAPISEIIKEIARQSNLQVYVYSDISGTITAKVDSVPVEEAFESLLRNTSSTYWLSRGIYFFADKSSYEKKVVDLIPVNYLQANDIIPLLPAAVASKATIKTVKEYNALLVEASTSDIIEQARNFITLLDKPIAQILIEAWVVEVKVDKARQFGVKMFGRNSGQATTATTYYPTFSKEYDRAKVTEFMEKYLNVKSTITAVIPEDFAMQIQALENEGISNLISKPQIATLNGHTATITFGTTQFFTLEKQVVVPGNNGNVVEKVQEREKIDVNMTLSVTPWVSSNNEVTMEVSPTFDVPGTSPGTNMPPPIDRRSLNSKVRVKSGEMIILGGLIGESQRKYIDKVPILGNIPVIGWLFSTKKTDNNKTQLMIYLIPHVYYGSEKSIDPTKIDFNSPKNTPTILESEAKSKKPLKKHWWFLWLR